jgi:hypothetical protein
MLADHEIHVIGGSDVSVGRDREPSDEQAIILTQDPHETERDIFQIGLVCHRELDDEASSRRRIPNALARTLRLSRLSIRILSGFVPTLIGRRASSESNLLRSAASATP